MVDKKSESERVAGPDGLEALSVDLGGDHNGVLALFKGLAHND